MDNKYSSDQEKKQSDFFLFRFSKRRFPVEFSWEFKHAVNLCKRNDMYRIYILRKSQAVSSDYRHFYFSVKLYCNSGAIDTSYCSERSVWKDGCIIKR